MIPILATWHTRHHITSQTLWNEAQFHVVDNNLDVLIEPVIKDGYHKQVALQQTFVITQGVLMRRKCVDDRNVCTGQAENMCARLKKICQQQGVSKLATSHTKRDDVGNFL